MSIVVIYTNKAPLLSEAQIKTISTILNSIGEVSLASIVIPQLFPNLDSLNTPMLLSGVTVTILAWTISVLIVRNQKT